MFFYHGRMDDSSLENQQEYLEQLALYEQIQEEENLEEIRKEEYERQNLK